MHLQMVWVGLEPNCTRVVWAMILATALHAAWVVTWSHKLRLLPVVQWGLACGYFRYQEVSHMCL